MALKKKGTPEKLKIVHEDSDLEAFQKSVDQALEAELQALKEQKKKGKKQALTFLSITDILKVEVNNNGS